MHYCYYPRVQNLVSVDPNHMYTTFWALFHNLIPWSFCSNSGHDYVQHSNASEVIDDRSNARHSYQDALPFFSARVFCADILLF